MIKLTEYAGKFARGYGGVIPVIAGAGIGGAVGVALTYVANPSASAEVAAGFGVLLASYGALNGASAAELSLPWPQE